jgi:hypothetical protein
MKHPGFVLAVYLALLPFGLPLFVANFEAYPILVRAIAAILVIAPLGLLLGFGFPTGMRFVNAIDPRPTPGSGRSTERPACWQRASLSP